MRPCVFFGDHESLAQALAASIRKKYLDWKTLPPKEIPGQTMVSAWMDLAYDSSNKRSKARYRHYQPSQISIPEEISLNVDFYCSSEIMRSLKDTVTYRGWLMEAAAEEGFILEVLWTSKTVRDWCFRGVEVSKGHSDTAILCRPTLRLRQKTPRKTLRASKRQTCNFKHPADKK